MAVSFLLCCNQYMRRVGKISTDGRKRNIMKYYNTKIKNFIKLIDSKTIMYYN